MIQRHKRSLPVKIKSVVFTLLIMTTATSCFFIQVTENEGKTNEKSLRANENLNAVLWMQTSAEYQMLCKQTFKNAYKHLIRGLKDNTWTAALEQKDNYQNLPPAIIVDVDETILDNSPFQASLIKDRRNFSSELWHKWVKKESARTVPGAKNFIKKVKKAGVSVFYVTNRELEAPTVANLQNEIDPSITSDQVFCKNEKPHWTSDKTNRRAAIAKSYRIVLLVGDDYNDFTYLGKVSPKKRQEKALVNQENWGKRWFILPNPSYGHFANALQNYNYHDPKKAERKKRSYLQTMN